MFTEQYLYKKEIDWSTLQWGFTLPAEIGAVFSEYEDRFLMRGEGKTVHVLLNGKEYTAKVTNEKFDDKFSISHKADIVRILYNKTLSNALMATFADSTAYLAALHDAPGRKPKQRIYLPEDKKEYLIIYATEREDTYIFEPLLCADLQEAAEAMQSRTEAEAEAELARLDAKDLTATVIEKEGVRKMRKLDKKIGDSLKRHYDFRCQICGARIGESYGTSVVDAHHIEFFTKSLNNDADNILIVCPNHHRIIHALEPEFNKDDCTYLYSNGLKEGLKYNDHIGK